MPAVIDANPPTKATTWLTLGFIGFLAAYVLVNTGLRGQFDVRYNDTTVLHQYLNANGSLVNSADRAADQLQSLENWKSLWIAGYSDRGVADDFRPNAYRPLQSLYSQVAGYLYFRFGPVAPYFLCFLLLGISGYLVFRLIEEVGSAYLAAACSAAYLFFPAVVSPAWNPLAGPQSIIPGAYAAGMLAYLRYLRTNQRRYLGVIAIVCLVGPWYKETIGIAPLLLIAHQLFVAPKKRWGLIAGLAVAAAHGIFPATALRLLLTGKLYLVSIFGCGALHDHAIAKTWRPNFLMDLVALVSPSLLLVSLVCIVVCTCLKRPTVQLTLPAWLSRITILLCRGAILVLAPAAMICLLAIIANHPLVGLAPTALAVLAAMTLYGLLYGDVLIAGWFCCMFLPLTRIYFNSTQCGYVAAPLLFLCIAPLFHGWQLLAARTYAAPLQWVGKFALAAVGLMAFCDNALSVPNAWIAYEKTGEFNDRIIPADLREKLVRSNGGKEWAFIENSVVVDDAVILATRFRFGRGTYNFDYGVPPSQVLRTESDVQRLLGKYNCALVIADHVNPFQATFWDPQSLAKIFRPVGEHSTAFDSYYADPLRRLIDNRYRSMMGPPDYQHEYAKETCLFRERFTNHYRILVREKGPADVAALGLTRR